MVNDLPAIFPDDHIYPEQNEYMYDLKRSLDFKGHCLLEMPSGTGKTLVEGLRMTTEARDEDLILANPILPDDLLKEAVPGNISQAQHFVQFLNRLIEYLRYRMRVRHC
ncbi:TFIIH/NER complex ATP-dependent 5'-3' DNA helicase subunit [Mycoemilia scoparia]|uniref:DNA 5'-3' helicase n=1 Tax=Mycoemilia scoparia TaxID=417184 RepID=A0A9W7ZTQ2_9FUNG|nr:TFIIH/NER complex ATP-dependent 5'-3' DNA helicase subunit [Mycoemilia scoparia]